MVARLTRAIACARSPIVAVKMHHRTIEHVLEHEKTEQRLQQRLKQMTAMMVQAEHKAEALQAQLLEEVAKRREFATRCQGRMAALLDTSASCRHDAERNRDAMLEIDLHSMSEKFQKCNVTEANLRATQSQNVAEALRLAHSVTINAAAKMQNAIGIFHFFRCTRMCLMGNMFRCWFAASVESASKMDERLPAEEALLPAEKFKASSVLEGTIGLVAASGTPSKERISLRGAHATRRQSTGTLDLKLVTAPVLNLLSQRCKQLSVVGDFVAQPMEGQSAGSTFSDDAEYDDAACSPLSGDWEDSFFFDNRPLQSHLISSRAGDSRSTQPIGASDTMNAPRAPLQSVHSTDADMMLNDLKAALQQQKAASHDLRDQQRGLLSATQGFRR